MRAKCKESVCMWQKGVCVCVWRKKEERIVQCHAHVLSVHPLVEGVRQQKAGHVYLWPCRQEEKSLPFLGPGVGGRELDGYSHWDRLQVSSTGNNTSGEQNRIELHTSGGARLSSLSYEKHVPDWIIGKGLEKCMQGSKGKAKVKQREGPGTRPTANVTKCVCVWEGTMPLHAGKRSVTGR